MDRDAQTWFTLALCQATSAGAGWRPAPGAPRNRCPRQKRKGALAGLKIALDPGHIGGDWAKMEERWFKVGDAPPVEEGEMTLRVARMLAPKLRALGARVSFVRDKTEPVTPFRPDDLKDAARAVLRAGGTENPREDFDGSDDPLKEQTVRWQSEILFYRSSEIRHRAKLVNTRLRPDLVLCLHFNAEAWGDERNPTFIDKNHLHLLVNGSYLAPELAFDDERFEMVRRLLSRASDEEIKIADTVAATMAQDNAAAAVSVYDRQCHHGGHERLRLRAQPGGDAALSMSGGLLRTLRHEQQRSLRAHPGWRLRRHSSHQRRRTSEHLSRVRRQRGRRGWSNIIEQARK